MWLFIQDVSKWTEHGITVFNVKLNGALDFLLRISTWRTYFTTIFLIWSVFLVYFLYISHIFRNRGPNVVMEQLLTVNKSDPPRRPPRRNQRKWRMSFASAEFGFHSRDTIQVTSVRISLISLQLWGRLFSEEETRSVHFQRGSQSSKYLRFGTVA